MRYALPFVIRPLRPIMGPVDAYAFAPWEEQTYFRRIRSALNTAFGAQAQDFARWLAHLYWRSSQNAWPAPGSDPAVYRRMTRCALHPVELGSRESLDAVLRIVSAELMRGPARKPPESGEVVLQHPEPGIRVFEILAGARLDDDLGDEPVCFAGWLWANGMTEAYAAETADAGYKVRRLVKRTCEGVDIEEEA